VFYNGIEEQKSEYFKIAAALFGVDTDKKVEKEEDTFTFQDPSEYEKMNPEKRKSLTEKMMNQHKQWAGATPLKGTE
jgi:hypothetical protein